VVIGTGGVASRASGSFIGPIAEATLSGLRVRKTFLGTTGVSPDGFSNNSVDEATIHRKMIAFAGDTFILADHTKFAKLSLALTAELRGVSGVVTDSATSDEALGWLRAAGVEVVVASP
jgi:DeoR family L-fucose operon activator